MSRSRKKRPFFSVCKRRNESDRFDKQTTHRTFRHRANIMLGKQEFDILPQRLDEIKTEYQYHTDGPKTYWVKPDPERFRK